MANPALQAVNASWLGKIKGGFVFISTDGEPPTEIWIRLQIQCHGITCFEGIPNLISPRLFFHEKA